jgi:hypothetical protein
LVFQTTIHHIAIHKCFKALKIKEIGGKLLLQAFKESRFKKIQCTHLIKYSDLQPIDHKVGCNIVLHLVFQPTLPPMDRSQLLHVLHHRSKKRQFMLWSQVVAVKKEEEGYASIGVKMTIYD